MSERTVGARIMEILRAEGVSVVSAYPTTSLIDDAARAGIRPVICRQERVGVNIADGYARITGGQDFGVFLSQYGPGAENAFPGVATAFSDSVPLLYIPLGQTVDRQNVDRVFSSNRSYHDIVKSAQTIRVPSETDDVMRRAISRLRNGRPGPALVEVSRDVAVAAYEGTEHWSPVSRSLPAPDPDAIAAGLELLSQAANPVIIAGQGVLHSGATAALVELAEATEIPVATTLEGKSAFPEDHPLALGCGALTMTQMVHDHFRDADVVLAVGASMFRHIMIATLPAGKQLVQITVDPDDFNRDYPCAVPILSDATMALRAMSSAVAADPSRWASATSLGRRDGVSELRSRWMAEWTPLLESDESPISPYRLVNEIGHVFPATTSIVTHESGSPRDQITPFYRATEPHSYIGWGKSHGLGSGLGLSIGAKLRRPEKHCVVLMGDAAIGMVGLDIETAVRAEIPIVVVVSNNGTMATETKQLVESEQLYGARRIGGDYARLAESLGARALVVEQPGELRQALETARSWSEDGFTVLVDVRTSPLLTPFSFKIP